MRPLYIGLDAGHGTVAEAEHWLNDVLATTGLDTVDGVTACTHLVRAPWPHVAVSLAIPGGEVPDGLPEVPEPLARAAAQARSDHETARSGRAALFPGQQYVTGVKTVADILGLSAITRVVVLGNPPPAGEMLVETRNHVRPQWQDGHLTLITTDSGNGRITPFELPNPTPCCANHP